MQVFIFNLLQKVKSVRTHFFLFLTLVVFGLTTCQKDPVATRNYPRLNTVVSEINASGAKFSAEIISGDPSEIIEYGFAWSEYSPAPKMDADDNVDTKGSITGKSFSSDVKTLDSDKTYNVRSFIKTNDLLIYGRIITFKTLK